MTRRRLMVCAALAAMTVQADDFANPPQDAKPQTWFHLIGGNVSKEGLTADLTALRDAGFGGIQLFHGQVGADSKWPRTGERIPCLSARWDEIIVHAADECARLGLKFEMQNCPGWSMSGGPWITPDKAMRKLVWFEPGKRPDFEADDDYHEIGEVTFPRPKGWGEPDLVPASVTGDVNARTFDFGRPVTVRTLILPPPRKLDNRMPYVIDIGVTFEAETTLGWKTVLDRKYPRGCWQDDVDVSFACGEVTARRWRLTYRAAKPVQSAKVTFSPVSRLDGWEALGGWVYHDLPPRGTSAARYCRDAGTVTLVFGHVNMKRTNHPAPAEATGWECDKLDARGCRANFDGYLGRLVKGPLAGGRLKGFVVDSWECMRQSWTWRMEEEFRRLNGYELRPNLPTLLGFPVGDPADGERFLRDWRRTVSTLIEENYYRTFSELGRQHGLTVQFETAFADVLPGDPLRYWKYADIPMCEFWQPFDNAKGSVGSDNYKPTRPCVSAAHVYGKRRVQAESFTSFALTYDENFRLLKGVADRHFARGVTHLVFHTYTHQPQTGADFLPPGTSFGAKIGTPFLRGQTWWKFLPQFTAYLARCGAALERGLPVVDVLWYLGDEIGFRPDENAPFPDGYKFDYCNFDVLTTRLDVRDGRFVLPEGMSYRVLWIPAGTFLLPETEKRLAALAAKGGRIVRGELKPDWPSPLEKLGFRPQAWYQRREGDTDIFFVVLDSGETEIVTVENGRKTVLDPVTGAVRADWKNVAKWRNETPVTLRPAEDYPAWATLRTYVGTVAKPSSAGPVVLSLGDVRDWAEVFVNGRKAATLWCEPYACDLGPFLKDGANEIRVDVTSTWYNRLVHDAGLPEAERKTWTVEGPKASAPLHESGLVGPVLLLSASSRAIPYDGPDWPDVTPEFDADAERFTAPAPKAVRTFDVPIRSEVRKVNGTPQLLVNGEVLPLFWSCVNAGVRKDGLPRPADLPFNVCTVNNFYPHGLFPKAGSVDFNYATKVADKFVETHPNAYLVWDVCVAPPKDWAKAHPDDLCRDDKGEATSDGLQVNWSLGSDDAVRVMADQVAQVVSWVEKSKYANRVIAYRVNGGHTTEWLAWQAASGRAIDFSPAALAAFRAFAAKRYGPSFAETRIPTAQERRAADGRRLLWNPRDHLAVVAYHEFLSERQADILIELCRVAKGTLEGRKAVGTYYGYTATLFADGNSQAQPHFALGKVLDSGTVDFLCSPQDYRIRTLGEPVLDMKPFGSIASRGLLSVIEDDTRTHFGRCLHGRGFGQTLTAFQSASLLRRNMGSYLCRGQPLYYYDLIHGTGFNFPEAQADARALRRVQELCAREGVARHAEIAVVVSESSVTAMPRIPVDMPGGQVIPEYGDDGRAKGVVRPRRLLSGELATLDLSRLSRIGSPFDVLLAEDLASHAGDYKLYVFLGCFRQDRDFARAVERLRSRPCTLLWTYAPGYIDGIDAAVGNMERLTGFGFVELDGEREPLAKFAGRDVTMGTPGVKAAPLFSPTGADKVLATYAEGGEPAVAMRRTGEATSVYSGVWLYSLEFLRSLAKRSGVHSYVATDDPVEANDALFLLHARTAGLKRVTLPRKAAVVTDAFTGKVVGRDCASFEFRLPLHGTGLFRFAGAPVELFNGKDLSGWYKFLKGRGRDNDPQGVITVTNGVIRITGETWGALVTEKEYSDYRLDVEYRWTGRKWPSKAKAALDSGILFHSTGPDGGFAGIWLFSHELNVIYGATGDIWTVGSKKTRPDMFVKSTARRVTDGAKTTLVYDPKGEEVTLVGNNRLARCDIDPSWTDSPDAKAAVNENPIGEWNTATLVCRGAAVECLFNGKLVNRATAVSPSHGKIQLQSEGCEIEYRRVTLTPLCDP